MIHWSWALGALFTGAVIGFLIMSFFADGISEYSYRQGYSDGCKDGFQAGLNKEKEIKNV
jgi:hypothetical protein